jgi:hypothetical protein
MSDNHIERQNLRTVRRLALAASLAAWLGTIGHASADAPPSERDETQADGPRVKVRDVVLYGTGCPRGSWRTEISKEGSAVDVLFQDYTTVISFRRTAETRDCSVAIALEGQNDVLYYPHTVSTQFARNGGKTKYEQEVGWSATPEQKSRMGFEDAASRGFSDSYHLQTLRSPCGGAQSLQIATRLQNTRTELDDREPNDNEGTATAKLTKLRVKFEAQRCGDAANTSPTPTPSALLADTEVQIKNVAVYGKDCDERTVKIEQTADRRSFTAKFAEFAAAATGLPGVCRLRLELSSPPGRSYALASYALRGVSSLPADTVGSLWLTPSFFGSFVDGESERATVISGPTTQRAFATNERFRPEDLRFSACGTLPELDLMLSLGVSAASFDGSVSAGQIRIEEFGPVAFVSRPCPPVAATE